MSTTQELLAAKERYDALVARIQDLADAIEAHHLPTEGFYVDTVCSECTDWGGRSETPWPCLDMRRADEIRGLLERP